MGLWSRPAPKICVEAAEIKRSQGTLTETTEVRGKAVESCLMEDKEGFRDGSVCMSTGTCSRPMHLWTVKVNKSSELRHEHRMLAAISPELSSWVVLIELTRSLLARAFISSRLAFHSLPVSAS